MAARGALEAMLTVTGQQEFAASMQAAMGSVRELAATTEAISNQMVAAGARMDAAFGAQRVAGIRAMNAELGVTRGHLSNIVGMLGGKGIVGGFAIYEAIHNASKVATNVMQWQSEAGVRAADVPRLQRLAGSQAGLGISNIDAGQMIRQIESAYSGRASTAQLQNIIRESSNLQGISGGRVSALDATSLLVPLLQSNMKFFDSQTGASQAAQIVNAMVGTGNMQTQDAMSILQTGAPAALAGLGIPLKDLAPFYAFGADTRGGQQAAPFARLLQNSIMRAMRPSKAGQKALDRLMPGVDVAALLKTPGGLEKFITRLHAAEAGDPTATQDTADIFGGTRGAATPLSIYGNFDLFQTKEAQFTDLNNPNYYTDAARLGQASPAQRWNIAKAGVSNALSDLGGALLPALTSMMPHLAEIFRELAGPAKAGLSLLSTAFGWLANPIVLRVIEGLAVLKGASMIANGVGNIAARAGAMQGGLIANGVGGMIPMSPLSRYRGALGSSMGLEGAVTGEGASQVVNNMGRVERAAGSLRMALVGGGAGMAMGAGLGATMGYTATANGGSLLAGGLEGALSGALLGMSAGPWGAAAGVVGGAAGAIVGHFTAMGKAASENAKAVSSSISSIVGSGQSVSSVIAGDVGGNMDLQLGLNKIGVTQGALTAAANNPALLAKYRTLAGHLKGNQKTQVQNLIDIVTGLQPATRVRNQAMGKTNTPFTAPSDQNILTWAEVQGIFPVPLPGTAGALLPKTSDVTSQLRSKYAAAHNLFYNKDAGFAPRAGDTFNIYPSAKMDELALARMVAEETKKAGARR